jgi:hypothetical protein
MSISHVAFHIRGYLAAQYLATWDTHMAKCIFIFIFKKKKKTKKRKKEK